MENKGPAARHLSNLLRNKLQSGFQSTCFMGIPSDRILLPSERGDKTSFFQYMNPWSLTACSVSTLGACGQRKSRASGRVPSVPRMGSGAGQIRSKVNSSHFKPPLCDDLTASHTKYKHYEAVPRGEECCGSSESPV